MRSQQYTAEGIAGQLDWHSASSAHVGTHALGPVPELPPLDEVPELPPLDPPDEELAPLLPLELAPASTLGASSSTRPPQATATSIETNAR